MKDYLRLLAVFAVMTVLIPCIGYLNRRAEDSTVSADLNSEEVKILFEESGEIKSYSMKDYIIGAVFAQMPANFETEALKSQAVLASTYARRRIISESENPTDGLNGAHLSDDSGSYQAFFTEEQAVEAYGDDYEEAYDKISEAAEYAENRTLTYDGEPILTAFHGISYGATESALTMWGEDIPYLQSVDSNWDSELAQCETVVTFSESEMKQLLSAEFDGGDFSGEPQDWISIAEKSEGGTALKIRAGGELAESSRLCKILGLPSAHFSVSYSDGEFTCTSLGCGHLVGMSQYGANEMAKQGKSSEEILLHYFPYTIIISS